MLQSIQYCMVLSYTLENWEDHSCLLSNIPNTRLPWWDARINYDFSSFSTTICPVKTTEPIERIEPIDVVDDVVNHIIIIKLTKLRNKMRNKIQRYLHYREIRKYGRIRY